jgi:hypothetical protein
MKKVWDTVDRWGPGALAVITFILVIGLGWQYDQRIARVEGRQSLVLECVVKQEEVRQGMKSLEERQKKDRSDWEFELAKINNFGNSITRLLIKAGLM